MVERFLFIAVELSYKRTLSPPFFRRVRPGRRRRHGSDRPRVVESEMNYATRKDGLFGYSYSKKYEHQSRSYAFLE